MSFDIRIRYRAGKRDLEAEIGSSQAVVALVGPSGAGKTMLLNCIAGLQRPTAGRVAVAGEVLFDAALGIDLSPERRGAGYVFQDMRLFPHLSVRRNLEYGAKAGEIGEWPALRETVDILDLAPLLDRTPPTLSGGEARRVAIGRALLRRPRFLLLDEPLSSLDAERATRILAMIERIRALIPLPILLVSHDRREIAQLTDCVVTLA